MALENALDYEGLKHYDGKSKEYIGKKITELDSEKVDKTTVATSSTLGLVKSGTDITVDSSGNVSVNDNSHKHIVSNISDLTATASELNVLDGITATTTELNYVDGVTSNIQTQLNSKVPTARKVNGKALSSDITLSASDVGADASGSASSAVSAHNTSTTAHSDIRGSISTLQTEVTTHKNASNPHGISKNTIGLGNVENKSSATIRSEITKDNVKSALGYTPAELDANGKVPSSQLPSYVDDVIEGYLSNGKFYKESAHTTVITGEGGKIYIDLSTNKTYRWSGSTFAVISETLALGEYESTAYRGDRGKIAYEHSQSAHAPSNAEKNQNAFSNVKVGSTTVSADTTTDTLELVAGDNVSISADASGDKITISATDTKYTLPEAGASLGGVKSGGDVTISNGVITVNDDSHNHVISNIDGLQYALDDKLDKSVTNLGAMTDKTIIDLQNGLNEWLKTCYNAPNTRATFTANNNFISLWNNSDTTNKISAGASWTVEIETYYTYDKYTLIKLTTYASASVYYVEKKNGVWGQIKKVSFNDELANYLPLSGGTLTGQVNIKGSAADKPLRTRGITGLNYDDLSDGELYLQYGVNQPVKLGNDGGYNISADGSNYSGNSATATALTSKSIGSTKQPVYFDGNGKPVAISYTIEKSVPSNAVFTDTHYTTGLKVGASATAASNAAATNGNVYLNVLDNTTVRDSHKIVGSGSVTVTSDANGVITINGTDNNTTYTHPTYTARTGKPTANQTPAFGGTATVSQITSDGTGHVTGMTDRTITIPSTLSNGSGTAGLIKTTSTVTSNSGYTACPVINGVPYYKDTDSNTDTKNTAGSTDSSKKLFLIGAESQAANPQTYSHDTAYVGTDGCLYSGGSKVLTSHPTISKSTDTTSTASPSHGGTITMIDSITKDSNGHVTKVNTKTVTLPKDNNTDTKVTQTVKSDDNWYPLLLAPSGQTSTTTTTACFDSDVKLNPSTNTIIANIIGSASIAQDANTLSGKSLLSYDATDTWEGIPYIDSDGIMEVGKYIDFHTTDGNTNNYDVRITATENGLTLGGTTTAVLKSPIRMTDDCGIKRYIFGLHNPTPDTPYEYGGEFVLNGTGNAFIGSGEAGSNLRNVFKNRTENTTVLDEQFYNPTSENLYIASDGALWLYSNCNTKNSSDTTEGGTAEGDTSEGESTTSDESISNRRCIVFNKNGMFYPIVDNEYILGKSTHKWKNINTYTINGYTLAAACARGVKTLSGRGNSGFGTNNDYLIDTTFISRWNGAYDSEGKSNLEYCNRGAFGAAATRNVDTTPTDSSSNLITSGAMYTALASKLSTTGSAASATKIYSTSTTSAGEYYNISFHADKDTSGNKSLLNNNGFAVRIQTGSTSTEGFNCLILGNELAAKSAGGAYGAINIFGKTTYRTQITAGSPSENRNIALPNSSGTLSIASSDVRLKENIKDTEEQNALSVVNSIKFRQFDWKESGKHQKIGVIADELETIDEHLVLENTGGYYEEADEDENPVMNVKCVDTFYLMGYYGKAIQELSSLVKEQAKEIEMLKDSLK